MSDNENTNVETKKRGQSRKTEAELRALFDASGIKGLLEVDDKVRCTVYRIDGSSIEKVYGPAAGNTFARAVEGCVTMGPLLSQ